MNRSRHAPNRKSYEADKLVAKYKRMAWPGQYLIVVNDQEVLAEVHRPKEFVGRYHATYVDPTSGRRIVTQVDAAPVWKAIERSIKGSAHA